MSVTVGYDLPSCSTLTLEKIKIVWIGNKSRFGLVISLFLNPCSAVHCTSLRDGNDMDEMR